jgi:hypothetical protein
MLIPSGGRIVSRPRVAAGEMKFLFGAMKLSRVGIIGLVLLALHSVTPPSLFYPLLPKYLLLVWRDC